MTNLPPTIRLVNGVAKYEPRYCDSLATAMEIPFVKLDLSRGQIRDAVESGIEYNGARWFPSGAIAASKGETPTFVGYKMPGFWQNIMSDHGKVAYERLLHTPLWEGVQLVTVTVQVVDDDVSPLTADGMFAVSEALCLKIGNSQFRVGQYRGAFFDVYEGEVYGPKVILKGVGVPSTLKSGIDMLVPKSCLKGALGELGEVFAVQMWLGVSQYAKTGSSRVGYQVMQYAPKTVWQVMDDLKDALVKATNDKTSNPENLISVTPAEDDDKSPIAVLKKMLAFGQKLGNQSLLKSTWATRQLQTIVSNVNTDLCVSGGLKATGRMAVCWPHMKDFEVRIASGKAGPGMVYRNPHTAEFVDGKLVSGMIPVKVVIDANVPADCIAVNENTARVTGLDYDGDTLNLIYANDTWHGRIWFNHLEARKVIAGKSTRSDKREAPASLAETLSFISELNIGQVANIDSDLEVARQAGLITGAEYLALKVFTAQAIHDAVDGQKRFQLPDMEKMGKIRKLLAKKGLTKPDTAFRRFSNGSLKGWMRNPATADDLPTDTPLIPSNYMSGKGHISANFHRFAPHLNVPEFDQIGNSQFINWLEDGTGKGAEFAKQAFTRFKAMRMAIAALKGIEEYDSMKADLNRAWRMMWAACDLTLEEKREAMGTLWHLSFQNDNEQSLLWNSLTDTLFTMLEERIEAIKKIDAIPVKTGVLVGKALEGLFQVVNVVPVTNKAGEQCQQFHLADGGAFITRASGRPVTSQAFQIVCCPITKATARFEIVA